MNGYGAHSGYLSGRLFLPERLPERWGRVWFENSLDKFNTEDVLFTFAQYFRLLHLEFNNLDVIIMLIYLLLWSHMIPSRVYGFGLKDILDNGKLWRREYMQGIVMGTICGAVGGMLIGMVR